MIHPPAFEIRECEGGFVMFFPDGKRRAFSRNYRLLFMFAAGLAWRPRC